MKFGGEYIGIREVNYRGGGAIEIVFDVSETGYGHAAHYIHVTDGKIRNPREEISLDSYPKRIRKQLEIFALIIYANAVSDGETQLSEKSVTRDRGFYRKT